MKVRMVGVLNDRSDTEFRVALVPDTVRRLERSGISVIVEAGAGSAAWYSDEAYAKAGAETGGREEVISRADVVITLHQPRPEDVPRFRTGQLLVGMLSAADPDLLGALASNGAVLVSLDRLPRTVSRAQSMDVLTSQASVAGYKAAVLAADEYSRFFPMLITAAGTSRPASVLVLGAGVAGLSAIGTARRLGAVVTGYDIRPETRSEVESLGARFLSLTVVESGSGTGGYARALTADEQRAQQEELESKLASFDVVITTAQVPGRRPPVLVTKGAIARMRPGTVLIDLGSSPLGGNVEGSVPSERRVTEDGVIIIGAGNLPALMPAAASDAISQNMASLLDVIVHNGEATLDTSDEVIAAIVVNPPTQEEDHEHLAAV